MKKSYAYDIFTARHQPEMQGNWDGAAWQKVPALRVSNFRVESSIHRPWTTVKLLYSSDGLHGLFMVRNRYIRCIRHRYQDAVYKDSCVEFFVQPKTDRGYFNFEGKLLLDMPGLPVVYNELFIPPGTKRLSRGVSKRLKAYSRGHIEIGRQLSVRETAVPWAANPAPMQISIRFLDSSISDS